MGLFSLAKKSVKELVDLGYPESVAKKIADGTLPMDDASREARAGLMNMTDERLFRGHSANRPPESRDDMFLSDNYDVAATYARGGEVYDEALDDYVELPGEVTPLRHNARNLLEVDANFHDYTWPVARVPEFGEAVGSDQISGAVKQTSHNSGLQGTRFEDMLDDYEGEAPSNIYNILGSRDDVQIRHADLAAFDPEYNGKNILGGAALPITAGLMATGQSEDADAGIIRHATPDVARLLQNGMLKTDSDRATASAIKKYDKLLTENPAFAHREELAGDNLFQTVREQSEFDLGQDGYLTMDDLRDYTIVPVRSDRSMIGTIDQVGGIEIPRETVQGGFQFPMLHQGTGRGWGSGETVARGQHNKFIQAAEETGREVLAAVNMMGPDSINFSTPIARQMQKQFDQLDKIPAADKAEFDAELRSIKGNEDWPGIDSPEAMDWLMGTNGHENIGKRRTAYSTTMGKAKYRDKGFPNYKEAVEAATHSDLIDLNLGDAGMAIYKPDLTRDIYADDWHDTYSHVMPGEYVGRLETPVPFGQMFSGKYDSLRNETTKGKTGPNNFTHEQAVDAANKRKDGFQVADDDWAQRVADYQKATQVRAVGAPGADTSLLSAQLHNHDTAVDEHMQTLGIDPREDPMYDYGTFLPVRENIVTGKSEMAMPSFARDMIRGLFDIAESRKSGVFRPDGLFEVL